MPNLFLGDCLDVLKTLPENSIDSLVTDPPAGIAFMGKSWDSDKGGRDHWIAWMTEIMREALRVMKPGAHGLVWGLPRTSHWTATALENAGFEIRDVVTHLFGQGFPKSTNVYKSALKQNLVCVCLNHEGTQYQMHVLPDGNIQTTLPIKEDEKSFLQHSVSEQVLSEQGKHDEIFWREQSLLEGGEVHRAGEGLCHGSEPLSSESSSERICFGTHSGDGKEVGSLIETGGSSSSHQPQSGGQPSEEFKTLLKPSGTLDRAPQNGLHCSECGNLKTEEVTGLGTALKPAVEFYVLVRKPLIEKTVASNVLKWRCGGLNIDESRIGYGETGPDRPLSQVVTTDAAHWGNSEANGIQKYKADGRFPSHLVLDEEAAKLLDEQSGMLHTHAMSSKHTKQPQTSMFKAGEFITKPNLVSESGGASRFFFTYNSLLLCDAKAIVDEWKKDHANIVNDFSNLSKASVDSALRFAVTRALPEAKLLSVILNPSITVKEQELENLCESVTLPMLNLGNVALPELLLGKHTQSKSLVKIAEINALTDTMTIIVNHWKLGGCADDATSITIKMNMEVGEKDCANRFRYCAKASKSDKGEDNKHPTVKSTKLMEYLIKLITPPNGVVLDCFAGSGSTGVAALRAGFQFIGVEKEAEYFEIAEKRIANL